MTRESDDNFRAHLEERVGRTLCNKYTLEKLLGVGGMASVYRASHRNGHRVAIKILHTELSISKDLRERFLREGYVANRVDHQGAVRVLDDDVSEDGGVFLVMELLEGETLEDYILGQGGTLSPRDIIPFACQVLDVLAAAHDKGIVHRDIKPENLFIERRDRAIKVLDFGIARLNDSARQATRTGRVLGTPVYMAPEQARGETKLIDGQTDIWAVGAILYRALTGTYVYDADTPEMVMVRAATQSPSLLADVLPGADPRVAEIVDRSLAWKKGDRWKTAEAMATALRGLRADELSEARAAAGSVSTTRDMTAPMPARSPADGAPSATAPHVSNRVRAPRGAAFASLDFDEETENAAAIEEALAPPLRHSTTAGLARTAGLPARPGPQRWSSPRAIGAVAVVLAVAGTASTFMLLRRSKPEPSTVAVSPSALAPPRASASAEAALPDTPAGSPAPVTAPLASIAASSAQALPDAPKPFMPIQPRSEPQTSPPAVAQRPVVIPVAAVVTQPAPPAAITASAPVASASGACSNPFYVDAQGVKKFRMECLGK